MADRTIKTHSISTLSDFVALVTSWDESNIFRGQTKSVGWPLRPSIARDTSRSRCISRERQILDDFKRESVPYLETMPTTDWQWLALGQHYRLPTRLLDWTTNPFAALWFAVKDPPESEHPGVVWAFYYEEADVIRASHDKPSPFSIERTYVYFPEHICPSIQAQTSALTVHHKRGEYPETFVSLEDFPNSNVRLRKITIAPNLFALLRYQLFRLGISPASLFPGLHGIAERIRYENMKCPDE